MKRKLAVILPTVALTGCILACSGPERRDATSGLRVGGAGGGDGNGGVIEVAEPWIRGCDARCDEGYLDLLSRHRDPARVLSEEALAERLRQMDVLPMPALEKRSPAALAREIREGLSIGFLLDGLENSPLRVATLDESMDNGLIERRLLFGDPEVGSFEGLLLLPTDGGPHAAVVGLHGHRDSAEIFAEEFLGRRLAQSGFAVLLPELRALDCSRRENRIATELLRGDLTLMGLHVYETLLMAKYLQHLEDVDPARIGLLAHSGGSSIADLAVRVSDSFAAKVTDYQVDYRNRCGPQGVHCETLPALFPLVTDITVQGDLKIPYLVVPSKFEKPAVVGAIEAFFRSALAMEE